MHHSEECFLGMTPMGYACKLGKGGMQKGPAVWPRVTSFSMFLSMIDGFEFAKGKVRIFLWGPRTRIADLKALGEPCKKMIK